ncbi:hypothetical protein GCM10023311_09820 [Flaviramulus aquimarinus]|uniref:Uncharacterized protein n=1 Tax=Flaviramulus aquimarinus TaxID=1170456 RepID=A0ABP9EV15_9FLAO
MFKKKYRRKIEEGFKNIFKTEIDKNNKNHKHLGFDDLAIIVKEPIVKHQIIQLAKLCEEVPFNLTLKPSKNGILIEFWKAINI